jgi:hypothetical protein
MALRDKQQIEVEGCIASIRETATALTQFESDNKDTALLAEQLGDTLNKLAAVVNILYREVLTVGNTIYDV